MSVLSSTAGFVKLKGLGQLQLSHMWKIRLFKPPAISLSQDELDYIVITARTFTLPALTRSKVKMRYLDREYTIPMGQTWEHEVTLEVVNDEGHKVYDSVYSWYKQIPDIVSNVSLEGIKTNGLFLLLSMDGKTVKKSYELTGIYPMDVPELGGWNQDSDAEHSKFTLKFAVDDILYDNNVGTSLEGTQIE